MPEEYTRKEAAQMILSFATRMQGVIDHWDAKRWMDLRKAARREYKLKETAPCRTANTDKAHTK